MVGEMSPNGKQSKESSLFLDISARPFIKRRIEFVLTLTGLAS